MRLFNQPPEVLIKTKKRKIMGSKYRKGYRLEDKVRKLFEKYGWIVIRSAGSKGIIPYKNNRKIGDLVCLKNGKAVIIECKATSKDTYYLPKEVKEDFIEGFPFFYVVNFTKKRRTIIALPKRRKVTYKDTKLERWLELATKIADGEIVLIDWKELSYGGEEFIR